MLRPIRFIRALPSAIKTSWCGFARAIVERQWAQMAAGNGEGDGEARGPAPDVVPIATAEYPTKAARPAFSVLDNRAAAQAFDVTMAGWRDQLDRCLS